MKIPTLMAALALTGTTSAQPAFDLKGYTTGGDFAAIDTKSCRKTPDVDSGVPGVICESTFGGEKAELRIGHHEGKVVVVIFEVKNAGMRPTLDALTSKYGRPTKPNQFLDDYLWRSGDLMLFLDSKRVSNGYSAMLIDMALFKRATEAQADKAKKDI